jgi:hypothetical protein
MNLRQCFIWVVHRPLFRNFHSGLDYGLGNYPALSYRHLGACRLSAGKLVAGSLFEYGNVFDQLFLFYISPCADSS